MRLETLELFGSRSPSSVATAVVQSDVQSTYTAVVDRGKEKTHPVVWSLSLVVS